MPFDEPVESQNDAGALPRRFAFPLEDEEADEQDEPSIGQRIKQLVPTRVVPDEPMPLRGIDVQQRSDNKPQVEAKPSIGQRIVQMGRQGLPPFDIQDGRPVWRQDPQSLAKPNIGQRIMRMATPAKPQFEPLPRVAPAGMGVGNSSDKSDLFSSFVPGNTIGSGAIASGSNQNRQYQTSRNEPGNLGKSAAEAAGAMAGVGLGAARALHTSEDDKPIVPVPEVKSKIKPPVATPEVTPNLNLGSPRQQQRRLERTLRPLMQSIRDQQLPGAERHLTQDDINEAAAVAYSENVHGTVRDYEAIISAILNRVRSGDRQFVDGAQAFTVYNVTHSKVHGDQFQGVPNSANYRGFATNHSQDAENARIAAEHIAARGPSHHWTFFIAPPSRALPTRQQVRGLGHNMTQVDHTDNVYLYTPRQVPRPTHRGHGHGGPVSPRSSPPQHQP